MRWLGYAWVIMGLVGCANGGATSASVTPTPGPGPNLIGMDGGRLIPAGGGGLVVTPAPRGSTPPPCVVPPMPSLAYTPRFPDLPKGLKAGTSLRFTAKATGKTADDPIQVTWDVNNAATPPGADGSLTLVIPAVAGTTNVRVTARNAKGGQQFVLWHVVVDAQGVANVEGPEVGGGLWCG